MAENPSPDDEGRDDDDGNDRQKPMLGAQRQTDTDTKEQVNELLRGFDGGAETHDRESADETERERQRRLDHEDDDDGHHRQHREDTRERVPVGDRRAAA